MTAQELAKGLRFCVKHDPYCRVGEESCPLFETCNRSANTLERIVLAADLIESMTAENQRKDEQIAAMTAELENMQNRLNIIGSISKTKTAMVESLTVELSKTHDEMDSVKRERDAAVAEIGRDCETCKYHEACHSPVFCDECGELGSDKHPCCTCENLNLWQWCGVTEKGRAEG